MESHIFHDINQPEARQLSTTSSELVAERRHRAEPGNPRMVGENVREKSEND